jgi:hypothetical protein
MKHSFLPFFFNMSLEFLAGAETQEIMDIQTGKEALQLSLLINNTNFKINADHTKPEVVKVMNSAM